MRSKVYKAITGIIAAIGVISGIVAGNVYKIPHMSDSGSLYTEPTYTYDFNVAMMFGIFASALILCLIFYGIASVLEYLEEIKASGYQSSNEINSENIQPLNKTNENTNKKMDTSTWKCPDCGRINQNYVGSCGCGRKKPVKNEKQETWECPNCHAKNIYNGNAECPNCSWKP